MLNSLKKLILLFGLISCMSLSFAECVQAQSFKEKHRQAQDTVKFLENFGGSEGKEYIDALRKDDNGSQKIMCGDKNTMCDKETEVCLMCSCESDTYNSGSGSHRHKEYGKCVSKAAVEKNSNLRAHWPDDGYCHEKSGRGIGISWDACSITMEKTGFVDASETTGFLWKMETTHIFTGADGKKYGLVKSGDEVSIGYGENENGFRGCEVFPVKVAKHLDCFYCGLAEIVYNAAQDMASISFRDMAGSFRNLIAIVFAIWLLLISANYVFSMTKQDAPKYLTNLLQMTFKVALVLFLLGFPDDIFRLFIRPLLESGINLGRAIQAVDMPAIEGTEEYISMTDAESYYGLSLYQNIESYLRYLQAQLAYIQALGATLFCVGAHYSILKAIWEEMSVSGVLEGVMAAYRMMFLGGFLFIFGLLITLAFGFYLIDALIHLIVIGAMLPLMIATWPLPFGTTKFATSGFKMLLNVFFTFFLMGFAISVCWTLIDECMSIAQPTDINSEDGGLTAMIDALYDQNFKKLDNATDIGVMGFLLLLFGCLFGFKFIGQATQLAAQLSGDKGSLGLASKVASIGASMVKGLAKRITKPVGQAISEEYHEQGGITGMAGGATKKIGGWMEGGNTSKMVRGAGKAAEAGGKSAFASGKGMIKGGAKLTAGTWGIGAIVGVPMMVVGAGMAVGGKAVEIGGKVAQQVSKVTEKLEKVAGKAVKKVGEATQKISKKIHESYKKED